MTDLEIRNEALKVSPVIGANVSTYLGFTLSDWVYITTIVYIVIQCACLLYKTFSKKKER